MSSVSSTCRCRDVIVFVRRIRCSRSLFTAMDPGNLGYILVSELETALELMRADSKSKLYRQAYQPIKLFLRDLSLTAEGFDRVTRNQYRDTICAFKFKGTISQFLQLFKDFIFKYFRQVKVDNLAPLTSAAATNGCSDNAHSSVASQQSEEAKFASYAHIF